MVDAPDGAPPVKRKRGRPRKADVLAAQAAAAAAAAAVAGEGGNGVPGPAVPGPAPSVVPEVGGGKGDPKPKKPRKKKGEVCGTVGIDVNLVGKTVTGVLDGSFDAGYLLSVRVGDTQTVLRGVVFGPGLTSPITKDNDIAPSAKELKREDSIALPALPPPSAALPSPPRQLGSPVLPHSSPAALPAPNSSLPSATFSAISPHAGASVISTATAGDVKLQGSLSQQQEPAQGYSSTVSQAHPTPVPAPTAVQTGA